MPERTAVVTAKVMKGAAKKKSRTVTDFCMLCGKTISSTRRNITAPMIYAVYRIPVESFDIIFRAVSAPFFEKKALIRG